MRSSIAVTCSQILIFFMVSVDVLASTICVGSCSPDLDITANPPVTFDFWNFPQHPQLLQSIPQQTEAGWSYTYALIALTNDPSNILPVYLVTLPYFPDTEIISIDTPEGWSFETGDNDIFGYGKDGGYMRWAYNNNQPSVYQASYVFSFVSTREPVKADYKLMVDNQFSDIFGDFPVSPLSTDAGLKGAAVPLPDSYLLLLAGIGVIRVAADSGKSRAKPIGPTVIA